VQPSSPLVADEGLRTAASAWWAADKVEWGRIALHASAVWWLQSVKPTAWHCCLPCVGLLLEYNRRHPWGGAAQQQFHPAGEGRAARPHVLRLYGLVMLWQSAVMSVIAFVNNGCVCVGYGPSGVMMLGCVWA